MIIIEYLLNRLTPLYSKIYYKRRELSKGKDCGL